jgi:hypothetical protein
MAAGDRAALGGRETASSRVGLLRRERETLPVGNGGTMAVDGKGRFR